MSERTLDLFGRGMRASTYNRKKYNVPPSRCLLILSHKLHVNIWLFTCAVGVLPPYLLAVMEVGVHYE